MVVVDAHLAEGTVRLQGLVPRPGIVPDIVRLSLEAQIVELQFRRSPGRPCFELPMALARFPDLQVPPAARQGGPGTVQGQVAGIHPLEEVGDRPLGPGNGPGTAQYMAQDYVPAHIPVAVVPLVLE